MRFVIAGNGIAGINVARIIAREGLPDTTIDVYTDEAYLYYARPKLPSFVAGEIPLKDMIFYPPEWYDKRGIRVHLGRSVARLKPADRQVLLSDGVQISYDRLLLANGGRANIPPFKGTDKAGVFSLRSLTDALTIQEYARQIGNIIVIGGGLLGLEVARGLKSLGPAVTVVEFFPRLLPRQLDGPGADALQKQVEMMGIQIVTGAATEEILGAARVSGIRLKDGQEIAGDMVVISAGVRSNVQLAAEAGLKVNRGIIVDNAMRTSAPDVWAAGDVAEFEGRVWGIIPAAVEQARVAGANIVAPSGKTPATYTDIVPSNTLKVVGIDLTSIGVVNPEGDDYQELRRIDLDKGMYEKLVLQKGRIVGAILLGNKDRVGQVAQLISRSIDVTRHVDELLDDAFELNTLL